MTECTDINFILKIQLIVRYMFNFKYAYSPAVLIRWTSRN